MAQESFDTGRSTGSLGGGRRPGFSRGMDLDAGRSSGESKSQETSSVTVEDLSEFFEDANWEPEPGQKKTEESRQTKGKNPGFWDFLKRTVKAEEPQGSVAEEVISEAKKEEQRKMVITMLGGSGSGKTSFLSGLYQTMIGDFFEGLNFVPDTDMDTAFKNVGEIANIAMINNPDFAFATTTDPTTIFPLSLEGAGERLCSFEFMDYRGGAVDDLIRNNPAADVQGLKAQLAKSDAILIFADATKLIKGNKAASWKVNISAQTVNSLFNILMKTRDSKHPLTILLVVTKVDDVMVPDNFKDEDYAGLIDRTHICFEGLEKNVQNHFGEGWNFGIIPVSAVGEGNVELAPTDDNSERRVIREGCVPEPFNIEKAMVYTIACVLAGWELELVREKSELVSLALKKGGRTSVIDGWRNKNWKDVFGIQDEESRQRDAELNQKREQIRKMSDRIRDLLIRTEVQKAVHYRNDHLDEYLEGIIDDE